MNPIVRHSYNVLRSIVVTILVAVVSLYALLYVLLCVPAIQEKLKSEGERQLSEFLHTRVSIGNLSVKPFNQLMLYDVSIPDQRNHKLFNIETLAAGISVKDLLVDRKVVMTYGEIIGLHAHIERPDKSSPTNMQFIIDALAPKANTPPKKFDLAVHNIVIRKSDIAYHVLDQPKKNRFDLNHLQLSDLRADIELPRLKNDDFLIDVKRMSFKEHSGLRVVAFSSQLAITKHKATASNTRLELPGTVLALNDFSVDYDTLKHIADAIKQKPVDIVLDRSRVTLSDFKAIVPALARFSTPLEVSLSIQGNLEQLNVPLFSLKTLSNRLSVEMKGRFFHLGNQARLTYDVPRFELKATAGDISMITSILPSLKPEIKRVISDFGNVNISGSAKGTLTHVNFNGRLATSLGSARLAGSFAKNARGVMSFDGHVETGGFQIGKLLNQPGKLGSVAMNANVAGTVRGKKMLEGKVNGDIAHVDYNGYRFQNIKANVVASGNSYRGKLAVNDPNGMLDVEGTALLAGLNTKIDVGLQARNLNLARMRLAKGKENVLSLNGQASFMGNSLDNATGTLDVTEVTFTTDKGRVYRLDHLNIDARNSAYPQELNVNSDFIRGKLTGKFDFSTLVPSVKGMLAKAFPDIFGQYARYAEEHSSNHFDFNFEVEPNDAFESLVKLPVKLLYKGTIKGSIDVPGGSFNVAVSAPYLQQGNKLVDGTVLTVRYNKEVNSLVANAHANYPSKNGKIALNLDALGTNNQVMTNVGWRYAGEKDYHGNVLTNTTLMRTVDRSVFAHIDVMPTEVVVNDTTWHVRQGSVNINHGNVQVDSLLVTRSGQFIDVKGNVSRNPADELTLSLQDVDLDYIFETLRISNVEFGGRATGTFYASNLLSNAPRLETPDLHIVNFKYNKAIMGDADIKSHWDNANQGVVINCDLAQRNGEHSHIDGAIYPKRDSLYFDFKANKANISFLQPFMAAFTSDFKGTASGHAILFGNFHTIDLMGDIKADSIKFHLDFTNVTYTCQGDSVHMKPGLIEFDHVRLHDRDRHEALMKGWVRHRQFHEPSFNFSITQAKNLLCYDTNEAINPVWYGTVYGNGSAFINGAPGTVNIKVNMLSAPRSRFTFVLSDNEEASEYNFITYRNRDRINVPADTIPRESTDTVPELVRRLTQKIQKSQQVSAPTKYMIDVQGDITPDMQLTLVMDPAGGDKIKATGRGNIHMTYDNSDEQLEMYGKYVLEKGFYNFTLQDIIIKDFTIRNGSTISFQGDPYQANLDIEAIYSLNANIRDLDESFASDREINRTNVPVHALLKTKGVISAPEISFDLEFPTLTSDAYRKVKSIISTDDMMNRQIIYLLALNRFYTPDYMNNSSSNHELTSVASSTISSQLSNLLGHLNENWSISPNFRSDKGDFSDVEVDLALSSQLLNNRLLFNGNFGYRDNAYNSRNSNFIGDFELEYLLNAKGSLRLKAYNHFNDQNYYLRNAMTTQGVGIVYKHDFDTWRGMFRRRHKSSKTIKNTPAAAPADSLPTRSKEVK